MKTMAHRRLVRGEKVSEEEERGRVDLSFIKNTKKKKKLQKEIKKCSKSYTRCARLKPLARAIACAGYNRERSKEAADILLRHVQDEANR
jgi:hypothetical protein